MNAGVLVTIVQGINALATFGPIAVGAALDIRQRLSGGSGEPFEVVIQQYKDGVLQKVEDTDAIIQQWRADHPEQA